MGNKTTDHTPPLLLLGSYVEPYLQKPIGEEPQVEFDSQGVLKNTVISQKMRESQSEFTNRQNQKSLIIAPFSYNISVNFNQEAPPPKKTMHRRSPSPVVAEIIQNSGEVGRNIVVNNNANSRNPPPGTAPSGHHTPGGLQSQGTHHGFLYSPSIDSLVSRLKPFANGRPRELKRVKLDAVLGSHPENMVHQDFRLKPLNQV